MLKPKINIWSLYTAFNLIFHLLVESKVFCNLNAQIKMLNQQC